MSLATVKVKNLGVKEVPWTSQDGRKSGVKYFLDVLDTALGAKRIRINEARFRDLRGLQISKDIELQLGWITSDDGSEWVGIQDVTVIK